MQVGCKDNIINKLCNALDNSQDVGDSTGILTRPSFQKQDRRRMPDNPVSGKRKKTKNYPQCTCRRVDRVMRALVYCRCQRGREGDT